jgi:hypothetical protein
MQAWTRDNTKFMGTLLLTIFLHYFLHRLGIPSIINRLAFFGIMLYAYQSKADYYWLAWFFVLNDAPGKLFASFSMFDLRLPAYTIAPGLSFTFQELFLFMYIIKAVGKRKPSGFVFRGTFTWFFIYSLIVLISSFFIGMDRGTTIASLKEILPWLWVLIIPVFINDEETILKASKLLFPMVILAMLSSLVAFRTGLYIDGILKGGGGYTRDLTGSEDVLSRAGSSAFIILFCMIQGINYLFKNYKRLNINYLSGVLVLGFLVIFLSATRGWVIALLILLTSVFFVSGYNFAKNFVRIVSVFGLLYLLVFTFLPAMGSQTSLALDRLMTLEELARGDVTAGGTVSRIDVRSPIVMNKFRESPVIGWGFSREYFSFRDGHVGNQNILLNVGILGFLFLSLVFIFVFLRMWRYSSVKSQNPGLDRISRVYAISMISVLAIHTSSTQFWGFSMTFTPIPKTLFFAFLFAAFSIEVARIRQDAEPFPHSDVTQR